MEKIECWINAAMQSNAADFIREYPAPVFLYKGTESGVGIDASNSFKTQAIASSDSTHIAPAASVASAAADIQVASLNTVFLLSKRPGVPFPDHISIGRARTNDVPINFPRISKLHAILTWNHERTVYSLTDVETTNGTFVDGTRLVPKSPRALPDGALVTLGPYRFAYHMPSSFYPFLRTFA